MNWSQLDDQTWLRTEQVAEWLGVHKSYLEKARVKGYGGPNYAKVGASVRYQVAVVRRWCEELQRSSTRTALAFTLEPLMPTPEEIVQALCGSQRRAA